MRKVALAHMRWIQAGRPGDADRFIEAEVKGEIVRLGDGLYIRVTSVMNAGLNGMQVQGKLLDDEDRETDVVRMGFWR